LPALIRFPLAITAAAVRAGWLSVELIRHTDTPRKLRWADVLVISALDLIRHPDWYMSALASTITSRCAIGAITIFTLLGQPPYPAHVHQAFESPLAYINPSLVDRVTSSPQEPERPACHLF
jgi:hypothetical protein